MTISVSSLFVYPIKSMAPLLLDEVQIEKFGPALDRRFMLVDAKGKFYTQRQNPLLSQFHISLAPGGLRITAVDGSGCEISFVDIAPAADVEAQVWDDRVLACGLPQEINAWLSEKLGHELRLVFMPEQAERQVDLQYAREGDVTSFNDGFPALLLSEESVRALESDTGFALSPLRFRPNIVVTGCEAFAEDKWQRIRIGEVEFEVVKPCSRCVIPTIDLQSGQKQPEVMAALLRQRKVDNKVFLGQNLIHRRQGLIRVGDTVEILA